MGGGDLNTKKAWHPSNLKNQERVWKAEQAAATEKKRIVELERERAQERDREELNALSKQNVHSSVSQENRLHWMYDKPDKQGQQEDYLLGKAIDKNYDQGNKQDQNEIPAVSRRVVGSSMTNAGGDVQVDLVRKLREDPLLLVKERERAARAALLNNPIQRRKLADLLRKEQEKKNLNKKKSKKSDLDELLASKLSALGGEKSMNLAKLLDSDSSSSESSSSSEGKKAKKKKKKKKLKKQKSKKHKESDSEEKQESKKSKDKKKQKDKRHRQGDTDLEISSKKDKTDSNLKFESHKYSSPSKRKSNVESDDEPKRKIKKTQKDEHSPPHKRNEKYNEGRYRDTSGNRNRPMRESDSKKQYKDHRREISGTDQKCHQEKSRHGLSQEEKAAKLAAMAEAGVEREIQRGRRVAKQLAEKAAEDTTTAPRSSSHKNQARILPESLESRIHSNRHNIQRDKRHMNENFARR